MADTRQSLFGPSPEEVAMMRSQQGQQDAMQWAAMPAGRGAVAAAANAGQAFGRMGGTLAGGQDPMQAKAQRLQAAQQATEQQAAQMGIDLASSPKDYYKIAAQTLQQFGLVDEAQNVMGIAQNHDLAEREMQVKERPATGAGAKMSGNIMYLPDGTYKPIPEYQGKGSADKPQSKAGKIIADRARIVSQFGEDSQELKDFDKLASEPDGMENLAMQIDARAALADRNNSAAVDRLLLSGQLTAERQAAAAERSALTGERAVVNKSIADQVAAAERNANVSSKSLESINTSLAVLEKSQFNPGFASQLKNTAGEILYQLGYPEVADSLRVNPADASTLNTTLKTAIADIAAASEQEGGGAGRRSATELQLFADSIGGLGTVPEGLYQGLKIVQKELSYGDRKYEAMLRFSEEALDEANKSNDPLKADLLLRKKMFAWKKENPNTTSGADVLKFQRAAKLMEKAKSAKPLEMYYTGKQTDADRGPGKWNTKELKPGKLVVDDDGVVKVFTGKFNTYLPGKEYEEGGVKLTFPVKTVVPVLDEYK